MEEISKKDLLKITGISYGQLYRWKRMGLIPEEWFVKKASFTGQETYFPKQLTLERIDKILELKDDVSLEDLSDIINNNKVKDQFKKIDILNMNILINQKLINFINRDYLDFQDIIILKILDNITDNSLNLSPIYEYFQSIKDEIVNCEYVYLILNKNDIGCILVKEKSLEFNLNSLLKVNIKHIIDNLKLVILV